MPPPPPPSTDSHAALLHSISTLASYSDTLADFLDQWNSVILDVASIGATFAALFPGPGSDPKPYHPAPAPEPDREPEPPLAPQPEPGPNAAPAPEPRWEREPSPSPGPGSDPKPYLPAPAPEPDREPEPTLAPPQSEPGLNAAAAPEPRWEREPSPSPEPAPAPNPDRERKDGGGAGAASAADLEHRCKQMNCGGVRRFVIVHLRDGGGEWLRQVVPGALRRAPDPAALVFHAVGRYYIRAESPDAEAACALLLELYVRAGCPRLRRGRGSEAAELLLRQEAREAALTWRSRLLRVSGAVGDAPGAAGARGLALFMAAFGVPAEFPAQELCDLVDAAQASACVQVLKASKLFAKKMRGEQNQVGPSPLFFFSTVDPDPFFLSLSGLQMSLSK
jgi:hypothetical protein